MDSIPVLNMPMMAPVPFKKALWMIHTGKAKADGPQGHETGLILLFSGLDAAILSDKGPSYADSHSVAGKVKLDTIEWDGIDPNEGMPVLHQACRGEYSFR